MEHTQTPQASAVELRKARAVVIATTKRISRRGEGWSVPSQSHKGSYFVALDTEHGMPRWTCTCPDWAERGAITHCKHIFSVEIVRQQIQPDGTAVQQTMRVTYSQDWHRYSQAQTHEREHFVQMLRQLCSSIPQPPRKPGAGRRPLPIADVLMAACMKVYVGKSGRRAQGEMGGLAEHGLLGKIPSYNSVFRYVEDPNLTPTLQRLVLLSASPLASFEDGLAIDSTGINLRTYAPGYRAEKYGAPTPKMHGWIKLHVGVGPRTHIIASIAVRHGTSGDSPEFVGLVEGAQANGFKLKEIYADKAYSSHANLQSVVDIGATPYVPFRDGTGDGVGAPESWKKLFHFFQWHRDTFLTRYGQRQNVEATFSSLKRTISASVRSKNYDAQINETLLMALAHNIRRVIHAMYEMGIDPSFATGLGGQS